MTSEYRSLLTLQIDHAYQGGVCPDFEFIVTSETARLMRGARMTAKVLAGVLHVFYEADDEAGAGAEGRLSATGRSLRFGLRLTNPFFANYTELAAGPASRLLCYDNRKVATQLGDPVRRRAVGRQTAVRAGDPRDGAAFELVELRPGPVGGEGEGSGGATDATLHYVHPELAEEFGVVDIDIHETFYSAPPAFKISFEVRRQTLQYYFLVHNYPPAEVAEFTVSDLGFVIDGREPVTFARVSEDEIDTDETGVRLRIDGAQVVVFRSQVPVPRRRSARRRIQLQRGNDVIVEHLPQPGPDRADTTMIVHLSR